MTTETIASKPMPGNRGHTMRLVTLARDIRRFAHACNARVAYAEDIGFFDRKRVKQQVALAELRAAVRIELELQCGIELRFVQSSAVRKFVYGCLPPQGLTDTERKAWLMAPLTIAGFPVRNHNEGDAVALLQYGLSEIGAPCIAGLLGTPEHFAAIAKEKAKERARAKRKGGKEAA